MPHVRPDSKRRGPAPGKASKATFVVDSPFVIGAPYFRCSRWSSA
jgi:hypothetical protein